MHHTISYYLAQARIAELHHQAQRDTQARAVRGLARRCQVAPSPTRSDEREAAAV
jgi:hypothetical protein